MRWHKNLRAAFQVVAAMPVRSLLLALPVGMATGLALATLAVDRGVSAKAQEAADSFGLDQVTIHGSNRLIAGKMLTTSSLTEEDYRLLQGQLRLARYVVPTRRENEVPVSIGNKSGVYKVFGVTPPWAEARHFGAGRGRFLDETDLASSASVCVIGQTVVRELFGNQDPLEQEILLNNVPFRVKGVLVVRGASPAEGDRDARVMIPFSTFYDRLYRRLPLDQIIIQLASPTVKNLERTAAEARAALRQTHRLGADQPDDFTVRTPMSVAAESRAIGRGLFVLMFGIAAIIAFVAAAILVVVFQQATHARRGEIGIRRAIGAEPADILVLIWVESLLISFAGAVVGLGLGALAVWGLSYGRGLPFVLDGVALATSLAGLLPARSAALVEPTDALRPGVG
jgi:putative ABC transport system permease protein